MIIVTGAKGLLGEAVVRRLENVVEVSRRTGFDLTDPNFVKKLPSRVDAIIHLAQSEQFRSFPTGAADMFAVNTESTFRLAEYGLKSGCKTFIYASTGGITNSDTNSFYANSKRAGELLLAPFSKEMSVTLLRYFFIYGPKQRSDMLIPRLVERVRNGLPITLQGENGLSLNPIYVEDAAEATVKALSLTGFHTIPIAGNEIITLKALAQRIGEELQKKVHFEQLPGSASDMVGDTVELKSKLLTPHWALQEGLRTLCC